MTIDLCCAGVKEHIVLPEQVAVLTVYFSKNGNNVVSLLEGDYTWLSEILSPQVVIEKELPQGYFLSIRALALSNDPQSRAFMDAWRGFVFMELDLEDITLTATY
ncbi:MAG: hypothetical protein IJD35_02995 [Clostridia bacterium]|nr:hypothetical protein [Clostridia bacterium]